MGHRYHLYSVPKTFIEETSRCQSIEDFKPVYLKYCNVPEQFEFEKCYAIYEIGKDLLCLEDHKFDDEMHLHGDTLFKSVELRQRFESEDIIVLEDREGLLAAIEWCRKQIVDNLKDLQEEKSNSKYDDRSQLDRMKSYVQSKLYSWESYWIPDYRPYRLDPKCEKLCSHDCYDFIIWDLVRIYKTFDWENNSIILMGW